MSSGENKLIRRRLAGAWLSSVISITLVLLLVGVASLLLVNAKSVSDYFKENVQVSVLMRPDVTEDEAMNYATTLDAMPFIKGTRFISKEEGTRDMTDMLGEDFLSVFETAPIPVSVDVTLKADYVSADSLELVKKAIGSSPLVDEVVYQQSLVDKLNTNLGKISLVLGIFVVLLLFISFVLINNTVRLNVFSKRFTIHTMKLVGASWSFIRWPFVRQAMLLGLLASVLSCCVLAGFIYALFVYEPGVATVLTWQVMAVTGGAVFFFGIAITTICTNISVNKFLRMKAGELYKI
jgi:cell division transport system permease protein